MAKKTTPEDKILKDLGQFQITRDTLRFSELEQRVLSLHDELQDLELERVLLEKSMTIEQEASLSGRDLQAAIEAAEREVLEAKANYKLRNSIVESVLVVDPILKAVHSGTSGDDATRNELKRLLNQRDVLALTHANLSASSQELRNALTKTQVETIQAVNTNRELALKVVELAAAVKDAGPEGAQDEVLQEQLAESTRGLEQAKRSRTLVKHVVSGIVAGSGIDWSQDDTLRALVLDEDY